MCMRKPSAMLAWRMLVLSLPKGIAAFVIIVVGLSAGLPLSVVLIGLPLLAATLLLTRTIMVEESRSAIAWLQGKDYPEEAAPANSAGGEQQGWTSWLRSVLKDGRSYRAILFGLLQLPIGIAAFTIAIVLPATAISILLSPVAYEVSMRVFEFDLFAHPWGLDRVFDFDLTSAHRSWIAGGVGFVLMLLLSPMFRGLGRLYAAWILSVAGPEPVHQPSAEAAYRPEEFAFLTENQEGAAFHLERGAPPVA